MKTMVTGATGFIGNRLVEKLLNDGNTVNVLCRRTSDKSRLTHSNIKIFDGDILDKTSIEEAMRGCENVYHLAAYARNWAKNPAVFFEYNTNSLRNIFDSALKLNVRRVLFTSSSVVFGNSNGVPTDESSKRSLPPLTTYEASKLKAEDIVDEYLNKGLEIVSVYPTRLFGPGILAESNSVTVMIDLYLKGKWRMILGNGMESGNYAFIDDVAEGMINAMNLSESGGRYILGGENLSFNKLFSMVAEKSDKKHRMIHIPKSIAVFFSQIEEMRGKVFKHHPLITPGWVKTFCLNWDFSSEKAIKEINFKITPFKKALEITLDWLSLKERRNY
jgi:nucleoside-diphosphate-sugar epimerase